MKLLEISAFFCLVSITIWYFWILFAFIYFNCWKQIKSDKLFLASFHVDLKLISVREFCYQAKKLFFRCANRFENNFVRADFSTMKIMSVISSSWTVKSWLSFKKITFEVDLRWEIFFQIILFLVVDEEEKVFVSICLVRLEIDRVEILQSNFDMIENGGI